MFGKKKKRKIKHMCVWRKTDIEKVVECRICGKLKFLGTAWTEKLE